MASSIMKDIRAKQRLATLRNSPSVCLGGTSPFSEFSNNPFAGYHLGECPSMLPRLPVPAGPSRTSVVIFTIVVPEAGNPYLAFYVRKRDNDTMGFHVAGVEHGVIDSSRDRLLRSFGVAYREIGHFYGNNTDAGDMAYSVYEVDSYDVFGHSRAPATDDGSGLWVTCEEMMSGEVLSFEIDCDTVRFVTDVGEGVTRLYKDGTFLPSPTVAYVSRNAYYECVHKTLVAGTDPGHIKVGDICYGILSSVFDTPAVSDLDGKGDEPIKISLSVGQDRSLQRTCDVVRVVYWGENRDEFIGTLEMEGTNEKCQYSVRRVKYADVALLSEHVGYMASRSDNVVFVVNRKMFLFD